VTAFTLCSGDVPLDRLGRAYRQVLPCGGACYLRAADFRGLFHPGGFEKERELTVEFRRWERGCINRVAVDAGFTPEWNDPFISAEGLERYGVSFFENYLTNPQSKLVRLAKSRTRF
jgi:hypothetical protein